MKSVEIFLLLALLSLPNAESKIVGAWVLPHGDIALDPSRYPDFNETQKSEAWKLNVCANGAGKEIYSQRPDIVFISSPHGIAHASDWSFIANTRAAGDVLTEGEPPGKWNISADLSRAMSLSIVTGLRAAGIENVSTITAFASDEEAPIRWGEVVPMQFAKAAIKSSKLVVMTQPTRRLDEPVAMIPGLQELGRALWQELEKARERVAVVISSDLAHTHDPNGPYGFSPEAQPFDDACGEWARTLDTSKLTAEGASHVQKALSCGYTGLVMLDSMIHSSGETWKPSLCANHHPTYYGMMVVSISRR